MLAGMIMSLLGSLILICPANIYLFKVIDVYFVWRHSDVFIANFEHISHLFLVFLLLTLNM